jgi:hypothetical protein
VLLGKQAAELPFNSTAEAGHHLSGSESDTGGNQVMVGIMLLVALVFNAGIIFGLQLAELVGVNAESEEMEESRQPL